jgi:hypothetical protein
MIDRIKARWKKVDDLNLIMITFISIGIGFAILVRILNGIYSP